MITFAIRLHCQACSNVARSQHQTRPATPLTLHCTQGAAAAKVSLSESEDTSTPCAVASSSAVRDACGMFANNSNSQVSEADQPDSQSEPSSGTAVNAGALVACAPLASPGHRTDLAIAASAIRNADLSIALVRSQKALCTLCARSVPHPLKAKPARAYVYCDPKSAS